MQGIIGIDLGTTNSCAAIFEDGRPRIVPYKGTYDTIPSMVAVSETGRVIVGHLAKRQAVTNLENTAYAFKRLIGRSKDSTEVRNLMRLLPYRIKPSPYGDVMVQLQDKSFTIPELSAMILRELKESVEQYVGQPVTKAVITVPAYFADAQRQATKEAGRLAGLEVLRVINEPTAAALAYGIDSEEDKRIAVYDLGGGTFDISILDIGGGVYKVLATGGDSLLGGEDFDQRLMDWVVLQFAREHNIDLREDKMALQRIKDAVERAKCELSEVESTTINLPFIVSSRSGEPLHLNVTVTRSKLEELTRDLVERTIRICRETLESAQISLGSIDEVILVGGQTRMPMVRRMVSEFFGKEPIKSVHPDHVVALGAAIQAHSLVEHDDLLLLDVTSHSLGIKVAGGRFYKLIQKNTTIPTHHKQIFTTVRDYQDTVRIIVLQGESDVADENQLLGEFVLTGIRKAPKGEVDIEVNFSIDADGIVTVTAKDVATGKEQSIRINKPVTYGAENEQRMEEPPPSRPPKEEKVWAEESSSQEEVPPMPFAEENLKDTKPTLKALAGEDRHERDTIRTEKVEHDISSEEISTPPLADTQRTPSPFSELMGDDMGAFTPGEPFSEISGSDGGSPIPFIESEDFGLPLDSLLLQSEDAEVTPTVGQGEFLAENFSPGIGHEDPTPQPEEKDDGGNAPQTPKMIPEVESGSGDGEQVPPVRMTRPLFADPHLSEMVELYEEVKGLLARTEEVIKSSSYGEEALQNIRSVLSDVETKGMAGALPPTEMEDLISRLKRTREMLRQIEKLAG